MLQREWGRELRSRSRCHRAALETVPRAVPGPADQGPGLDAGSPSAPRVLHARADAWSIASVREWGWVESVAASWVSHVHSHHS